MSADPDERTGTSDYDRGTSTVERGTTAAPYAASQVVALTVDGATQQNVTRPRSWAAVKKSGAFLVVKAETAPLNNLTEWKRIRWSNGDPVLGHPNHRRISRATSRKHRVEASLGGSSAYADIWIVWAKIRIMTRGMRPPNAAHFDPPHNDNERLGPVTHNSPPLQVVIDEEAGVFVDFIGAAGKVIPVATLSPKEISKVIKSGWAFKREVQARDFLDGYKHEHAKSFTASWVDDTSRPAYLRLTPDDTDRIYDLDAPNLSRAASRSAESYNVFRQWIELNGERCSDIAPWFWRARWKLHRDVTKQITLNELSEGQIKLPNRARYREE